MEFKLIHYQRDSSRFRFLINSGSVEIELQATHEELEELYELIQEELDL